MNQGKITLYETEQDRWEALVRRDQEAIGAFFYGVATTGIYCQPACSSRLPSRQNVRFFVKHEEAEAAGFRPCRRCRPDSPNESAAQSEAILEACRLIQESETPPSLSQLAEAVGYSPSHFHRIFKRAVGLTPKQYSMEKRLDRVRNGLQTSPTVTEAVYDAGFASSSRFYDDTTSALGMRPTSYRQGGAGTRIRYALTRSYLGWVLVAATTKGICAVDLGDSTEELERRLQDRFPKADLVAGSPGFEAWVDQVLDLLESPHSSLDLPLDVMGTAFQRRVWTALREIPPGSTATYGDIATRIDQPKAARAVAQACGSNQIAVVIPCHRVVRSDGGLGGYRWGSERKRALLERETEKSA